MSRKKEQKASKPPASKKEQAEQRLLDKHPYETMSQVQNRYGNGRAQSGSDGTSQEANRLNH